MSKASGTLPSFLTRRDTEEEKEVSADARTTDTEAGEDEKTPAAEATAEAPATESETADATAETPADDASTQTTNARQQARRLRKRNKALKAKLDEGPVVVETMAAPAKAQKRHWGLGISFLVMVMTPVVLGAIYLWGFAANQYASTLGFAVRSEESASATDILGGIAGALGGGSTTTESDILYEFISSQELVAAVDARLDLEAMFSMHLQSDPLLSYDPDGTIEDLTEYWQRMVRLAYDSNTGLMELRVLAFTPEDAKAIADVIFDESQDMINALSDTARRDAMRYAREDLERAVERLTEARQAITAFRLENQIIDPETFISGQSNLLSSLQTQLAEALIELDLLRDTTREGDPRLSQAKRRIEVIEEQIKQERAKFGSASGVSTSFAKTVAEFERLTVDRQFAEQSYTAALSALEAARAEANRQSLYLAAYIRPQIAQQSEFPKRAMLTGLVALFSLLAWAITALVYYSLRDRR